MRGENPGMRINLLESREKKTHPLLEKWLNGSVVLASTSAYRRDRLVELGFKPENITLVSTSDEREKEDAAARIEMVRARGGSGMEGYDVHVPVDVAAGKIQAVLENQAVSPDAMIIAADTVTHTFHEIDGPAFWEAVPTSKPGNQEVAKTKILSTLTAIAYQYCDTRARLHFQEEFTKQGEKPDEVKEMLLAHYREQFIQGDPKIRINVNTGVAVRLPHETDIRTFNVEEHLHPEAIYHLVDSALGDNWSDLTDQEKVELCVKISPQILDLVIKITSLHPDVVGKVSGGIPFHDPAVREILGVTFMDHKDGSLKSDIPLDEGLFKGMPGEALNKILKDWALELGRKTIS